MTSPVRDERASADATRVASAETVAAFAEADAIDRRILEVTRALALVQALNPNAQDGEGFNNADYPAAFVLAAAGRVDECASLLMLYPRQSAGYGLEREVLLERSRIRVPREDAEFQGTTPPSERDSARSSLRAARARVAGRLHWIDTGDGELVFNGVGLTPDVRRALAGCVRTESGWRMTASPEMLHRFFQRLGASGLERVDRLEILQERAGPAPVRVQAPPPPKEVVLSHTIAGNDAVLQWTLPFSPEGAALRQRVKQWGAKFDGYNKTWHIAESLLPNVAYAALLLPGIRLDEATHAAAQSLEPAACLRVEDWLAALARGATMVDATDQPGGLLMQVSERRDDIYNALRRLGIAWKKDAVPPGYFVPTDMLPAVVEALQGMERVEIASLTDRAFAVAQQLVEREQRGVVTTQAILDGLKNTPTGQSLMPWQPEGVAHLVDPRWRHGRLLNDGVGGGKTVTGAMAAHILTADQQNGNILIICPAHLTLTWRDAIQKFIGDREFVQVVPDGASHVSRFSRWTICSYHLVVAQRARLEALEAKVLILDEAQNIRNDDAAWTKCIVGEYKAPKPGVEPKPGMFEKFPVVWPMTASEITNRPRDLFNLLKVTRHPLASNFFSYGVRFCNGHQVSAGRRGMVWDFTGASNLAQLGEELKGWILRRTLDDVANLPPRMPAVTVRFELTPKERAEYQQGVRETIAAYKAGADALTAMTAAMRACALVAVPYTIRQAEAALDSGIKFGIISRYPEVFDRIEAAFPGKTVRIDGSVVGGDAKHAAEAEFQTNAEKRIVLLQTTSATGLTLISGVHSILNDLPFSRETIDQAEGRFRRIGTTGTVTSEWMHPVGTLADDLRVMVDHKGAVTDQFRAAVRGESTDNSATRVMSAMDVAKQLLGRLGAQVREEAPAPRVGALLPDAPSVVATVGAATMSAS